MATVERTRYVRSASIRRAARGMPCSYCGRNDGTTVWAHSNRQRDGKGMGIKATDTAGAFLCHRCHSLLDAGGLPAEEASHLFDVARERSAAWREALR